MTKLFGFCFLLMLSYSCNENPERLSSGTNTSEDNKAQVDASIDKWHQAASNADFDSYFSLMTDDAVFIGTDATENWRGNEFKNYAEPHFKNGKAWDFKKLNRTIFLSEDQTIAWFDELLKTQMGVCRGSGVLIRQNNTWKIKHYVLSMTIPNDQAQKITAMKSDFDKSFIEKSLLRK